MVLEDRLEKRSLRSGHHAGEIRVFPIIIPFRSEGLFSFPLRAPLFLFLLLGLLGSLTVALR